MVEHDRSQLEKKILKNSHTAVLQARNAVHYGYNISLKEALQLEKNMCAVAFATHDREEGMKALSDREKTLLKLYDERAPVQDAAKKLNTDPGGLEMELKSLQTKIDSFSRQQSKALTDVTPEMVFDKVKGLLKK